MGRMVGSMGAQSQIAREGIDLLRSAGGICGITHLVAPFIYLVSSVGVRARPESTLHIWAGGREALSLKIYNWRNALFNGFLNMRENRVRSLTPAFGIWIFVLVVA